RLHKLANPKSDSRFSPRSDHVRFSLQRASNARMGVRIRRLKGKGFPEFGFCLGYESLVEQFVASSQVKAGMSARIRLCQARLGFSLNLDCKLPEGTLVVISLHPFQRNPHTRGGILGRSDRVRI